MRNSVFAAATALMLIAAPAALADEFTETCEARTAEHFPDIAEPATSCACITQEASAELIKEMKTAETPAELPEEALEIMAECGYVFPEE